MSITTIHTHLENLGLNHHERSVYMALLTQGQQPASSLALRSKTPRSTIRSILDRLCSMGIVDKIYRGNTQLYSCLPADALVRYLERDLAEKERQSQALRALAPAIDALRNAESHRPAVRYFEGEKGIIEAFNHSLASGANEILFMTSYDFFQSKRVRDYDIHEYLPTRVRKKIFMRVLSDRNEESAHWQSRSKDEFRSHRYLPKHTRMPGSFFIYGQFVLYFSANKGEYIAVLTESPVMAETMRTLFECLWNTSAARPIQHN